MKEWGVKGHVKALPLNENVYFLAPEITVVLKPPSGGSHSVRIKSLKKLNKHVLISFYGIDDPETALKYRGALICADKSLLPSLQDEEYFYEQLIGLAVCSTEGDPIGTLSDIFPTGSNDVYVVKGRGREYLIPAIRDVIRKIDLEEGKIVIRAIEGLLD